MKLCVVGAGYVGLVTAACFAELGHDVVCVDHDPARVMLLNSGGVPIYEPGLDAWVQRHLANGRLSFVTSIAKGVDHADVIFIAVGTPPQEDGSADLQHVRDVAQQVGQYMTRFKVIVNKSTVPVGTGAEVTRVVQAQLACRGMDPQDIAVVSNPEFLKEGAAIEDFMRPDRIVIGLPIHPKTEWIRQQLAQLYAPFNRHHERTIWMDVASAELTKYASNAMLATRISFMNEIARLADRVGADVDHIRRGMGADQRIGHGFLYAGCGYGGSCFPKDTKALVCTGEQHGVGMRVVSAVEAVNATQKTMLFDRIVGLFGPHLRGLTVAVWGLAFKPNTNDMREAPSLELIHQLLEGGATVHAYDPVAMPEARTAIEGHWGQGHEVLKRLHFMTAAPQVWLGADVLILVTEWKCFHNPDFELMKQHMRRPILVDGRNVFDPQTLQDIGIAYCGVGRRNTLGQAMLDTMHEPQATHGASMF